MKTSKRSGAMSRWTVLAILALLAPLTASGTHEPYAEGHILVGGPWVSSFRSTSVLIDRDSVDGFFFDAPSSGTTLKAEVTRNGGCPLPGTPACRAHRLSMNFHSSVNLIEDADAGPRVFLRNCTGDVGKPVVCEVPEDATTGEVAAISGVDLDVRVSICHDDCG